MRKLIVFMMLFALSALFMPNETQAFDNDVGIEMPKKNETQAIIEFDLDISEGMHIIEWYSQPVKEKTFYLIPLSAVFTNRYDKPPNTLGKKIYVHKLGKLDYQELGYSMKCLCILANTELKYNTKYKLQSRELYENLGYSKAH